MEWRAALRLRGDVLVYRWIAFSSAHEERLDSHGAGLAAGAPPLVTLTGLFELIGAVGLLLPWAAPAAAYGLMLLLVAMFPANVHAARAGLQIGGRRASPLGWRLPLQIVWIASLWWVARASVT